MDCLVTIDAGTGSGRCVVFDARGVVQATAQEPFVYRSFEDPNLPMVRGFDLDAPSFWGVLVRCMRGALGQLPGGARIRGVIATSQREGCVFVDAEGEVLYGGPNLDARAVLEGMEVQQVVGAERLHAITGHAPPYIFPIARLQWFRKHHDLRRIASLLMLNDWITYRLSGERVAELSNAGESMLCDVTARRWSAELIAALDVPPGILPPLCLAGTRVGSVSATASAETGLPEGTPVFAGGADTQSALLGSGARTPGQAAVVLGTTAPVQLVTGAAIIDPRGSMWTSSHVVADRWVLESNGGDTGGAYRWLLELLMGASDAAAHAAADAAVAATGAAPRYVFSHLGPAIFDLQSMNPFRAAGFLFRFPILHIDRPSRGELLYAFHENVAFAIRANWEQIVALAAVPLPTLRAGGGMTRSASIIRRLADAMNVPVTVAATAESASLGCAVLAAVGAGLHADVDEALAAMSRDAVVEPDAAAVPFADERYHKWREHYGSLGSWTL